MCWEFLKNILICLKYMWKLDWAPWFEPSLHLLLLGGWRLPFLPQNSEGIDPLNGSRCVCVKLNVGTLNRASSFGRFPQGSPLMQKGGSSYNCVTDVWAGVNESEWEASGSFFKKNKWELGYGISAFGWRLGEGVPSSKWMGKSCFSPPPPQVFI